MKNEAKNSSDVPSESPRPAQVKDFNPEHVSFFAETDRVYSEAVGKADSLATLRAVTKAYRPIANDAYLVSKKMSEADFARFVVGRANERKGKFDEANFDLTGPILMPSEMMKVSMIAVQFCAPWGVAYNRLKEFGRLTIKGGVVRVDVAREFYD